MLSSFSAIALIAVSQAHSKPPTAGSVQIKSLKTVEGVRPQTFAAGPRGSLFALSLEDKTVEIMNAATRVVVKTFMGHPQPAMALAWSQDGTMLASGDESARIFLWNAETGAKLGTLTGHQRGIQALSFNYPRTILLSTGKDDVVKLWNPSSGKAILTIPGEGANFYSATFRGKVNSFGVGILGAGAREYDDKGRSVGTYTGHNGQGVFDIAYNAAGTRTVTAGRDGTAIVWDTRTHTKLGSLKGHGDWVVHCAFSPNGKWIATSGDDRTVRIWNPYTFQQVGELDDQSAVGSPLCWTADGKYLLTVNFADFLEINSVTPPQSGSGAAPAKARRRRH
jgi:WD40 repeat protein